jgi:Ca2+-binding EF-hand superfamily protein
MALRLVGVISILALMASPCLAQQTPLAAQRQSDTATTQLLQLMDKDQNGKVSKAEFMNYMSTEFDRLDVNHDGELDVKELSSLRVSAKHPGGAGSK